MRYQGKITHWKNDRGFGFITPNGGGKQVFLHITSFTRRPKAAVENQIVTYDLNVDSSGRHQAANAELFVQRKRTAKVPAPGYLRIAVASSFLLFVAALAIVGRLPMAIAAVYPVMSLGAYWAYANDKSAATSGGWRTPEDSLHLIALVGGWPGALIAQRLIRHKSAKKSFQQMFWTTVALNCGALGWLVSSAGVRVLRSLIGSVA